MNNITREKAQKLFDEYLDEKNGLLKITDWGDNFGYTSYKKYSSVFKVFDPKKYEKQLEKYISKNINKI